MNILIEIHRINCPIREEINSFLNFKVSLILTISTSRKQRGRCIKKTTEDAKCDQKTLPDHDNHILPLLKHNHETLTLSSDKFPR